ncbi:MAG: glycosyltransferase family 2 protein [Nitrospirae bacterium]|nr:glycosyltransferase family 2 protein [Nitrospirota bacterium]
MQKKIPVSIAIIVKNEERNIAEALESVRDFDDIVVVDSFSDDRTVELCRKYTDRVYQHEWVNFSKHKQIAVDYAKNEWVFILDADERATPALKAEIVSRIKDEKISGYFAPRKNYFLGRWIRHSGWWPDYSMRLFRKSVSHLEPREVHERVLVNGLTAHLKEPFEHYTYRTVSEYIAKMERYSTMSAKEIYDKKAAKAVLSIFINPPAAFFRMYFLQQGFRDGLHGFVLAALYSFYTFLKYLKVWERKHCA